MASEKISVNKEIDEIIDKTKNFLFDKGKLSDILDKSLESCRLNLKKRLSTIQIKQQTKIVTKKGDKEIIEKLDKILACVEEKKELEDLENDLDLSLIAVESQEQQEKSITEEHKESEQKQEDIKEIKLTPMTILMIFVGCGIVGLIIFLVIFLLL